MAEHEFPNNSLTARPNPVPEKHVEQVTTKPVKVKKVTPTKRVIRRFLAEDVDDIGDYLVWKLIVPEIKGIVLDFVAALLTGERRSDGTILRGSRNGYTPYSQVSKTGKVRTSNQPREDRQNTKKTDFDSIIFETKTEAENVLRSMGELLTMYQQVTVADLYELIGVSNEYTDNYYGWTDLNNSGIRRVGGGYKLELPAPIYLR